MKDFFFFFSVLVTRTFLLSGVDGRLMPAGAGYVGAGYNVLLGNNDGARFASGGPDPGIRMTNVILKKTFSSPEDYCPTEAVCAEVADGVTDDQFSLVADMQQYQKLYSAAWDFESGEPLLPLETTFAGSTSSPIDEAIDMIEEAKSIIIEKRNVVVSGELRYNYKENKKLTSEFLLSLCDLPVEYAADPYRRFIASWGTHLIVAVRIGRTEINRYEVPFKNLNSLLLTTPSLLAILKLHTANSTASYSSESFQDSSVVQTFVDLATSTNATFRKWRFTAGSLTVPAPLHILLRRLDYFIKPEFIQNSLEDLCPVLKETPNLLSIQSNFKQALLEYPLDPSTNVFFPLQREFKIDWPKGSYALIKNTNCPETQGSNVWFGTGKREFLDVLGMYLSSLSPTEFDLDLVPYGRGYGKLTLRFCVKEADSAAGAAQWPMGSYCIFRKHECPFGFEEGSVATQTRSLSSDTEALPSGVYTVYKTTFEFCCRNDKPVDEGIVLPPSQPFTLLSTSGHCQKVLGMESQLRILSLRKGSVVGVAPFVTSTDLRQGSMKIHFCYYKRWAGESSS